MKFEKSSSGSFESKMDMTPLIDCIFQLILFLVLTSQINVQLEEVDLPFALEGKEADKVKEEVAPIIINVKRVKADTPAQVGERKGDILYQGIRFGNDGKKLAQELRREVAFDAGPQGRNRGMEAGPGGRPLSKLSVLVRADKGVRGEYLRTIFLACQEAAIYRIRFSSTTPTP
jgi:hypothetical protein